LANGPGERSKIRVFVAARSNVVRAGLESVVRSSALLELAGAIDWSRIESTDGAQADVLLIDAGDMQTSFADLSLPVVQMIETSDAAQVNAALRSGVRGIISRDATSDEIEGALHAAAAGLVIITPDAAFALLSPARPPAAALAEPLSARELAVLTLLVEGLSNKLIAHQLEISEHTVKTHVTAILAKLGAASRTEAVSQAIRRGLVML
jgi:NarL family two-component system response regulator YdfI